jgi:hypothetical protein
MKSRKNIHRQEAKLFEQAAKIIIVNALAYGWKKWEVHYQKETINRATAQRLAQAAEIINGLAHLAGTGIHPKKGVLYSMFGNILAKTEIPYLPHSWRRLAEKAEAVLSGLSPGEVVKLPRRGNQNRRLKAGQNRNTNGISQNRSIKTRYKKQKVKRQRLDDSNSLTDTVKFSSQ